MDAVEGSGTSVGKRGGTDPAMMAAADVPVEMPPKSKPFATSERAQLHALAVAIHNATTVRDAVSKQDASSAVVKADMGDGPSQSPPVPLSLRGGEHGGLIGTGTVWKKKSDSVALWKQNQKKAEE